MFSAAVFRWGAQRPQPVPPSPPRACSPPPIHAQRPPCAQVLDKLRDLQVPHFLDADNRGVVHALVVGSPELAQAVAKLLEA